MKGKHFQALVLDYKFQDGEIAVQVEWKDGPAGQCADIKDQKQAILLSEFEADYFLLPRLYANTTCNINIYIVHDIVICVRLS